MSSAKAATVNKQDSIVLNAMKGHSEQKNGVAELIDLAQSISSANTTAAFNISSAASRALLSANSSTVNYSRDILSGAVDSTLAQSVAAIAESSLIPAVERVVSAYITGIERCAETVASDSIAITNRMRESANVATQLFVDTSEDTEASKRPVTSVLLLPAQVLISSSNFAAVIHRTIAEMLAATNPSKPC